jgi:ABC-2 type transport system permease protein
VIRDKKSLLFLALMPIAFTLIFGFAFRWQEKKPRLPVGWVNRDPGGALSTRLHDLVAANVAIELVAVEGDDATIEERVEDEEYAAVAVVPEGFSAHALAGEPMPLTLIVPNSMAGQTATTAIQAATKRLLGAVEAAQLSVEAVATRHPFADATMRQVALEANLAQAMAAWQQPAFSVDLEPATGAQARGRPPSGFQQSSPGMLVQFAIFGLMSSATVLVLERKEGTLKRMLAAPVPRVASMAGHLLALFSIAFLQGLLLVVLGQLAFGVNYTREPLGTLLMLVALGLWVTSLGLLIGALAKTELQVMTFAFIAMILFAALGGAWFPLETAGSAFSRVGHLLPTAWAMDGLQNIVVRGQDLSSTLLPAGIVLAYTAAFFGLAVWRFRFE